MAIVTDEEQAEPDDQTDQPALRRPWRTPRLPPLVGAKDAAEIIGVSKMQLSRWMQPGSGISTHGGFGPDKTYMLPPARTNSGPVWVRSDVERFAVEWGRRRAPSSGD